MKVSCGWIVVCLSAAAFGQTVPALQCVANAGVPPTLRAEGLTELVGDIVLQCTGGTPTSPGQTVPPVTVQVSLNTNFASRLLPSGLSEALLLIDEPTPGAQSVCTSPPCSITAPSNPGNVYSGATGQPNIFQGQQTSANAVTWAGVPFMPPGTVSTRVIRITNVRANANAFGLNSPLTPASISASISISGASIIPLSNPQQTVGFVQPGFGNGVLPGSFQSCIGFNGNGLFSELTPGVPSPAIAHLVGSELYQNVLRPLGTTTQNVPGTVYGTESGFTIPSLGIGVADFGTTIKGTLQNVPTGVQASIPLSVFLQSNSSSNQGTAEATQTGTVSGSSMILTPDSWGNIDFSYQITQRTLFTILDMDVPVTFLGAPSQAGYTNGYITGVLSLSNQRFSQTTLFAPGSSLLNSYPIFNPLDAGVSTPAIYPYQQLATLVPCINQGNTLSVTSGNPTPSFIGVTDPGTSPVPQLSGAAAAAGPTLIAPRVSNVGLISTLLATPNITVVQNPSATWLNVTLNQTTTPATAFLSVNAAPAGNYSTTLQFNSPAGGSASVPVTYTVAPGPWFTRDGFTNGASYVNDVVAPGEPFVLFGGDNFGPETLAGPMLGSDGRAVSTLGDTQVLFDGTPAPLYYSVDASGTGQVAGFAPFGLSSKKQTEVQVVYNGVASPPITLNVLDAVPGLYTADSSGGGQGSILNQNASVNGPGNPEAVGNLVVLYGGGAGQTTPSGRDGALAGVGGPLATLNLPVKVFIDGIAATNIPYAGPAPGIVEGVFQIDVQIPAGVRHNANVPVVVQIEDKQTQPGVTLSTK